MRTFRFNSLALILLLAISLSACSSVTSPTKQAQAPAVQPAEAQVNAMDEPATDTKSGAQKKYEDFDPNNFDDPTNIDNQWLPLKPGMQYIYEGVTEEGGEQIPHRVIFTVTDLTKVINGINTVVIWDQDFSADVLVETELAFFAQDNDGNVWRMGEYPEVYEGGKLVENPAWISGLKGAVAGIMMHTEPQIGMPSYSQGWAPAVDFTDRGQIDQMDQQTCVPADCYEGVLVVAEYSESEPNAFQIKYYAPGVGNIRVGWSGADATKETLELVEIVQLSPSALEQVRASAFELENRGYEISMEVYDQTEPALSP